MIDPDKDGIPGLREKDYPSVLRSQMSLSRARVWWMVGSMGTQGQNQGARFSTGAFPTAGLVSASSPSFVLLEPSSSRGPLSVTGGTTLIAQSQKSIMTL